MFVASIAVRWAATCLSGEVVASYGGREQVLRTNDAMLFGCSHAGEYGWRQTTKVMFLRLPRSSLEPLVGNLPDVTGRLISGETDMLRLLIRYIETLFSSRDFAMTPGADGVVASHVCDLVALSLGASHDFAARGRSASARHGCESSRRIFCNLDRLNLANWLPRIVSPRAVQRCSKGRATLSAFVLGVTATGLRSVGRSLCGRNISTIAFESGTSSLANRCFRKNSARRRPTYAPAKGAPAASSDCERLGMTFGTRVGASATRGGRLNANSANRLRWRSFPPLPP
jgi:hypothetical protein